MIVEELKGLCAVVLTNDPMSILQNKDDSEKSAHVAEYYGVAELFHILQTGFIIVCVCAVLVSLIALLFVNKAEMIADKKADVLHKLGIVFIISSFAGILGIISTFVGAVF